MQAKECILSSFLSPVKEANRTHREERGWWGSLTGIRQRPPCDVRFEPRLRNEEERTFSRQNIMQTGLEVAKGLGCQNTRRNQCPAQLGDNVAPPEVGEAGGSRADGTGCCWLWLLSKEQEGASRAWSKGVTFILRVQKALMDLENVYVKFFDFLHAFICFFFHKRCVSAVL